MYSTEENRIRSLALNTSHPVHVSNYAHSHGDANKYRREEDGGGVHGVEHGAHGIHDVRLPLHVRVRRAGRSSPVEGRNQRRQVRVRQLNKAKSETIAWVQVLVLLLIHSLILILLLMLILLLLQLQLYVLILLLLYYLLLITCCSY